jgi:hypothetical protein
MPQRVEGTNTPPYAHVSKVLVLALDSLHEVMGSDVVVVGGPEGFVEGWEDEAGDILPSFLLNLMAVHQIFRVPQCIFWPIFVRFRKKFKIKLFKKPIDILNYKAHGVTKIIVLNNCFK